MVYGCMCVPCIGTLVHQPHKHKCLCMQPYIIIISTSQQGAGVTEEGGVLWLPGNVAVELVMVPRPSDGPDPSRKGLRISSYYVNAKEQVHVLLREYAPDGELLEVRSRTAIKGNGWVGGAM